MFLTQGVSKAQQIITDSSRNRDGENKVEDHEPFRDNKKERWF
jgi:hypothetical protein